MKNNEPETQKWGNLKIRKPYDEELGNYKII